METRSIIYLLVGIWLLFGIIACWRDYHGYLKHWYELMGESYWKSEISRKICIVQFIFYFTMIWFGPIILYSMETNDDIHKGCWWFTTKNK